MKEEIGVYFGKEKWVVREGKAGAKTKEVRAKSMRFWVDFAQKCCFVGEIYAFLGRFRPKCLRDMSKCGNFAASK